MRISRSFLKCNQIIPTQRLKMARKMSYELRLISDFESVVLIAVFQEHFS